MLAETTLRSKLLNAPCELHEQVASGLAGYSDGGCFIITVVVEQDHQSLQLVLGSQCV